MAKPDCDDGWIKISVELEAALDFADFTKMARTILRYAFLQLFGSGKRPTHAVLSCTEIAERTGRSKQLVSRGLQELTAAGAVIKIDGTHNSYKFVKNYERWVVAERAPSGQYRPSSKPLLTDREIEDCKDSPRYARDLVPHPKGRREVTQTVDKPSPKRLTEPSVVHQTVDDPGQPNGGQVVHQTVDELSTKRLTNPAPPCTPL